MSKSGKIVLIAWPDTTARGDEMWYKVLKNLHIVKNLNFRVGHAALLLIAPTHEIYYYDFGRYITPRGFGRARSAMSDPYLQIPILAETDVQAIHNLAEVCQMLESNAEFTHGKGPMYFSIDHNFNFEAGKKLADEMVARGSMLYGAMANNNSSCSRFVWSVYRAGKDKANNLFPDLHETIMPSPISNVVNGAQDRLVYRYDGSLDAFTMNRRQSLSFFIRQLSVNFNKHEASKLPSDFINSTLQVPKQPSGHHRKYFHLSGIGESAWYGVDWNDSFDQVEVTRIHDNGIPEYTHEFIGFKEQIIDFDQSSLAITYDSNMLYTTFSIGGKKIRLSPLQSRERINLKFDSFHI